MAIIGMAVTCSKGRIVIPQTMREYFSKGEKLFFFKNNDKFILEKMDDAKNIEDLEFALQTEEAWRRIEKGEAIEIDLDDFLKQVKNGNALF